MAAFTEITTASQRGWLHSTKLPLRRLEFHRKDAASTSLLQTVTPEAWPRRIVLLDGTHACWTVCSTEPSMCHVGTACPGCDHVASMVCASSAATGFVLVPSDFARNVLCFSGWLTQIGHAQDMLEVSEAAIIELRNVHVPHEQVVRARLVPLSRFASLETLTLCRVFGNKGDPAMTIVLRRLPTSLRVSQRALLCNSPVSNWFQCEPTETPFVFAR